MAEQNHNLKVGIVIPCYNVAQTIKALIQKIPANVDNIICVNDASTDNTLQILNQIEVDNSAVEVLSNENNLGVGGAVIAGYRLALARNIDVIVKLDGDGQMNPDFIPLLVDPIIQGKSDYTKGNRFFDVESIKPMPLVRIIGNAGLSFFSKLSTGYWSLFDPTNGFTAINAPVLKCLPLSKISNRYFFESDLLFRLSIIRAKCTDIPMHAFYGDEESNLSVINSLFTFPAFHSKNFFKRVLYNYFLRNFSIASVNLVMGILLAIFGGWYGIHNWVQSFIAKTTTPAGVVMLAALPIILGSQALLNFLSYDIENEPSHPISENIKADLDLRIR